MFVAHTVETSSMSDFEDKFVNQIICGDCLEVMRDWPDGCVDLVLTDPPYNVGKDYGPTTNDKRSDLEYGNWYLEIAIECHRVHKNGYLYVSCTVNQLWNIRPIWEKVGYKWVMMLIWHGPNYASNSNVLRHPWRLLYEPIMMFLKGDKLPMLNDLEGIDTDAIQRWTRPQSQFSGFQARDHPTQKPVGLYWTLLGRTPGLEILDPFCGSGTTCVATKMLGRRFIGIDISEEYCEIARQRLRAVDTGVPVSEQRIGQRGLFE